MSEQDAAAARRADYARALREEREGYQRLGREDRVAEVDAEIARVEGAPIGRSETPTDAPPPETRTGRKRPAREES